MTIKKSGEKWLVDVYPDGRAGKRVRKKFDTKSEASRFERFVLTRVHEGKSWNDSSSDKRTLSDLVNHWHGVKGVYLKDAVKRKNCLLALADWMGNPIASKLSPSDFLKYS